eukprot:m.61622 g.61622  ORF g.61622 m.61622 type:complete len:141 (-) comp7995_c1_seq2:180-602(-)
MIYNLHLYDRSGKCLYWKEWKRPTRKISEDEAEANRKMLYGLLFSLKRFAERLSPNDEKTFHSYKTGTYKLHCFETVSGMKFVLCTDKGVGNITKDLQQLFAEVYVPYVVKSPIAELNEVINSSIFDQKLDAFISKLKYV